MYSLFRTGLTGGIAVALMIAAGAATAQTGERVATQAQLVESLQRDGYADVRLSTSLPNPYDPHPELAPDGADPKTTPIHPGWNGTATRNGETVNVYVDGAGRIETR